MNRPPAPRALLILSALLACAAGPAHAQGTARDSTSAFGFVLDYAVPPSPAFSVLGVSPSRVLSGSAAKPVVVSLLDPLRRGGRLEPDLALDFSPYLLFGGGFRDISEYRDDPMKRVLANTQLSVGTARHGADTADVLLAWGARVVFRDDRDPLLNPELAGRIRRALTPPPVTGRPGEVDEEGEVVSVPGMSEIYADAVREALARGGSALALGYGSASLLRGGVASADSVRLLRHAAWIAGQRYHPSLPTVLAMAQLNWGGEAERDLRIGAALKGGSARTEAVGEIVYSSAAEGLLFGANATFSLVRNIKLVASIGTDNGDLTADGRKRVRVSAKLLYNLSETMRSE